MIAELQPLCKLNLKPLLGCVAKTTASQKSKRATLNATKPTLA
jgi:hypothetical protein